MPGRCTRATGSGWIRRTGGGHGNRDPASATSVTVARATRWANGETDPYRAGAVAPRKGAACAVTHSRSSPIPIALLISVAPVAADTFGAPGTYFYTSSTTCTTSGGMDTCNDVILNVTPDDTGAYVACLELQTFTTNGRGGGSLKSHEAGCAPAGT